MAGRPSPRARERLEERFAAELGLTRAAWDDALRRSDERWSKDDAAGVVESLEGQRRLLQLLEHRLCEVVSSAAVEREAERVVGTVAGDAAPSDAAGGAHALRASGTTATDGASAAPAGVPDPARSRHQALAGAGAAVAATMVAIAVAVTLGVGSPPVPEVAAPVEEGDTAAGSAAGARDRHVAVAEQHAVRGLDPTSTRTNWLQELRTVDLDPAARATAAATPDASPGAGAMPPPHRTGDGTSVRPAADEMADGSSAEGATPDDDAPRGGDGRQPESGDEADPADGSVLPELADLGSDDGTDEDGTDDTEEHDTEGHDVGGDDVEGHELHRRDVDGSLPDAGEEL